MRSRLELELVYKWDEDVRMDGRGSVVATDTGLRVEMSACGLLRDVGGVGANGQLLVLCCAMMLDYGLSCAMILDYGFSNSLSTPCPAVPLRLYSRLRFAS